MSDAPTSFRPEIQSLRAIAVLSVVLFHAWPAALPGGYVGVDVFFVISGFLITGMLVREAEKTGRISILGFYERRVRRLIPAATLVLAVVALASPLLPMARWADTAFEIGASALYLENWQLAASAVDYLAAGDAASPVQHYWSLSIEEQFYLAWPILLLLVALAATRFRQSLRHLALAVLGLVTLGSLAISVFLSHDDPAQAYFVTQTRIWELGLGGLLALANLPAPGPRLAEALRAAGLLAIVASCIFFTSDMEFPGYIALLPVLGCVAVIAAGSAGLRFGSMGVLGRRPVQFVGDISYSAYLWHWPMLVFAAALTRHSPTLLEAIGVMVATLVVATLSKRFVEDRFRHPSGLRWRAIAGGAASIAVCLLAALALYLPTVWPRDTGNVELAQYPGPDAFLANAPVPKVSAFLPLDVRSENDYADVYHNGCHQDFDADTLHPCAFGSDTAHWHVILAGDSHAASWIPAFEELAPKLDLHVETDTKSSCPLLLAPTRAGDQPYTKCLEWGRQLLDRIKAQHPDLVILSMSGATGLYQGKTSLAEAVAATWRAVRATGARLVVIADTPRQLLRPAECIEIDPACGTPKAKAMRHDAQVRALKLYPDVGFIDMTDAFCRNGQCPVIIGNVIAWRDDHHFTATYSRMLAPALGQRLVPYLE